MTLGSLGTGSGATLVRSRKNLARPSTPRGVTLDGTYWNALHQILIRGSAGKRAAAVFAGHAVRGLPLQQQPRARAELPVIDAAVRLNDLRSLPRNSLEALRGNRRGQHSIRINDQWRICFVWRAGSAWNVEITDYHSLGSGLLQLPTNRRRYAVSEQDARG